MSKLWCPCGHVIVDNTDNIPYKAVIFPDEKEAVFFERLEEALRALLEVDSVPARERWLARSLRIWKPSIQRDLSGDVP